MVTELVKTAVAAKCLYDNAGMTGNYECAYSLGLLSYIEGLDEKDQVTELESIYKEVMDNVYKVTTDDKKVKQLIKILGDYELKPKFDEQMNELYHMGYADKTIM
jgi:hypothetical protein|uniref:DUF3837 family protein n=1 Tax=Lachnospira sp. TaxID=2049031 RepID=UPI003FEFCE47